MSWKLKLGSLFRGRRVEQDLDEELRFHLDRQIEANIASGMSPEEARLAALREFGGVTQTMEQCRELRPIHFIEATLQDLRYGLRTLRRSPGFTAVAVLTLALGIGANTAIFSLIDALMLRRLPIQDPGQIVQITAVGPRGAREFFSYPLYELLRDHNQVFSGVLINPTARVGGRPIRTETGEPVDVQLVSGNYFAVLGVEAALGLTITPDDDKVRGAGGPQGPVAVLSYPFWQRRYALDPSIVGKTIALNKSLFTIVGVAPAGFSGIEVGLAPSVYIPVMTLPQFVPDPRWLTSPQYSWLKILARLKPGISRQQARDGLEALFHGYQTEMASKIKDPGDRRTFLSNRLELAPAATGTSGLRRQFSMHLFILLGVVALVLLIACANIANLLLARAAARQKEIAVRLAIGAGRGRLVRQLLTESVLLAGIGGCLGLAFAHWGSDVLVRFISSSSLRYSLDLGPDSHVLGFTAAVSILTGLLFGLAPALQATAAGLRVPVSPRPRVSVSRLLVVSQVALSLVLLIGAGLFVRTLRNLQTVDAGFTGENVLLFSIETPEGYPPARRASLNQELLERLGAMPAVRSASIAAAPPVTGGWGYDFNADVEDYTPAPNESMKVFTNWVAPRFFETLGTPLLMGREFVPQDSQPGVHVAIINESMARRWFGRNPLGARFQMFAEKESWQVIGVVKDVKYMSLREHDQPAAYFPDAQGKPRAGAFLVRTVGLSPTALASAIRNEVRAVDKAAIVTGLKALDEHTNESLLQERLIARLSGFFGLLALLLVCVGLYGVMSYGVARRTSEIGIRMALGAEQRHVLWLVLRETLLLVTIGVAIGLPAALAATRVISSLLFGLTPTDPATIAIAIFVMLAVAALAGYLPANRASRIDPMVALRYE